MNRLVFALLVASVLSVTAAESARLVDTTGQLPEPLKSAATRKATVIIFTLPDCPIANAFAPEINRLVADYSAKGAGFYLAHVDRDLTAADARKHAKDFGIQCPVLLDSQHALVKALGATRTPQAFLLDAAGKTVYHGRINNLFADYGTRRQVVTQHDLRNALDAVLAGKPVPKPVTEAIGCHIQTSSETKTP
jgi:thiol-disulfide isomerase/thioredoxin